MTNTEIQSNDTLSLNDYMIKELSAIFETYCLAPNESILIQDLQKLSQYWKDKKTEEALSELTDLLKKSLFNAKTRILLSYDEQVVSSNALEKLRYLHFFLKKIDKLSRTRPAELEKKINKMIEEMNISVLIDQISKELNKIEKIILSKKKKFSSFESLNILINNEISTSFKTKLLIHSSGENDDILLSFFNDKKNINSKLMNIVFELYEKLNKFLDLNEDLKIALNSIFPFLMKFRITFIGSELNDLSTEQSPFSSFKRYLLSKEDILKKEPRKIFSYKEPLKKESSSLFFKKNK